MNTIQHHKFRILYPYKDQDKDRHPVQCQNIMYLQHKIPQIHNIKKSNKECMSQSAKLEEKAWVRL